MCEKCNKEIYWCKDSTPCSLCDGFFFDFQNCLIPYNQKCSSYGRIDTGFATNARGTTSADWHRECSPNLNLIYAPKDRSNPFKKPIPIAPILHEYLQKSGYYHFSYLRHFRPNVCTNSYRLLYVLCCNIQTCK